MKKTTFVVIGALLLAAASVHACATRTAMAQPVTAAIGGADASRESRIDDRWHVEFRNANAEACRVTRYRVIWNDGDKTVSPRDLVLAPNGHATRTIGLAREAAATAHVLVEAKCTSGASQSLQASAASADTAR